MPEGIEVEYYRRLAERAVRRRIEAVEAPDAWFLKGGLTEPSLRAALVGRTVLAARRRGKLLVLDTDGPGLGLRFGMTGRLLVGGEPGIDHLEYGSDRDEPAWDRLTLHLQGTRLVVRDPRRLGAVLLDPDESGLGPDAFTVGVAGLAAALRGSAAPLKARLLDQGRLAGVGNLIGDEVLWRAALDPGRPAGSLTGAEIRRLHRHLRRTLDDLLARGGSHTGDLYAVRVAGGACPKDRAPLVRRTIGGRTTWSCPRHQR